MSISTAHKQDESRILTLAGLPTFCPITFHLFASYSLIASRSFTDCATSADVTTHINEPTYLIFGELRVVHVLQMCQ